MVIGESIVVAVVGTGDGGLDVDFGQALGVADAQILGPFVGIVRCATAFAGPRSRRIRRA
jgi:hypothetical protein